MNGCDYSTWRPPSMSWFAEQGFEFVCRYLAPPDDDAKVIHAPELAELRGAGLAVVLNWETSARMMLGGRAQGQADAEQAVMQAEAMGVWPCGIYFSADFDATEADQGAINAYLSGCVVVMGWEWVGVYGGYWVVKRALDAGACRLAWQTFAWSGDLWDGRAQLRQIPGGGDGFDLDESTAPDFGQIGGPAPQVVGPSGPAQRFVADQ